MSNTKQQTIIKRVLIIIALLTLLAAVFVQHNAKQQDVLGLLQAADERTASFTAFEGKTDLFQLQNQQNQLFAYAAIDEASGYGGNLSVLTVVNTSGEIENVVLLQNYETPLYLRNVLASPYLDQFHGQPITADLTYEVAIDGVSGATMTSRALLESIQKSAARIGATYLNTTVAAPAPPPLPWQEIAAIVLVLFALLASHFNWKKLRPALLVASVIVLGFWLNSSLTLANFTMLLGGDLPSPLRRPLWYLLVFGVPIITIIIGKNFYCSWLCPFGAVQEGIYKALHLVDYTPPNQMISTAAKLRWPLIWLACLLALIFGNLGIAGYEPFTVCFDGKGNTGQWIIMLIVFFMSIGVSRFWCRCFCPIGAILNSLGRLKYRFTHRKATACPQGCANCPKAKLSGQDKMVAAAIIIINLLIIFVLVENILLN